MGNCGVYKMSDSNIRLSIIIAVIVALMLTASTANAEKPTDPLWDAVNNLNQQISNLYNITAELQNHINNIQLIPGPKGDPGEQGIQGPIGPQGPAGGLPTGFSIMGDTETPPSGYTYTGNHLRADNLASDWTVKAPMPTARFWLSAAVVNDRIYAIGGTRLDGTYVPTNEEYNPLKDMWTTKTPMPTSRARFGVAVVNNKIYAIGGVLDNINSLSSAIEEYDPVTDTWTTKAPLPTSRNHFAVTGLNGKIYVMGGGSLYSR